MPSLELWFPSFPQASHMQTAASASPAATQNLMLPTLQECLGVCAVVGIMDPITAGWYQVSHLHLWDISSYLTRSPKFSKCNGHANLTSSTAHFLSFSLLFCQFSSSPPNWTFLCFHCTFLFLQLIAFNELLQEQWGAPGPLCGDAGRKCLTKQAHSGYITTQALCWWRHPHMNTFSLQAFLTLSSCCCSRLCQPPLLPLSLCLMRHWATSGDVSTPPDASLQWQIQL